MHSVCLSVAPEVVSAHPDAWEPRPRSFPADVSIPIGDGYRLWTYGDTLIGHWNTTEKQRLNDAPGKSGLCLPLHGLLPRLCQSLNCS